MSFLQVKPGTLLSPTPVVMVSCGMDEHINIMTAAWVGTVNSTPPMVSVSIRPNRWSYGLVHRSGEYVLNLVSRELAQKTDYCGVKSGRDINKWEACGFTPHKVSALTYAPAIAQAPAFLACKVVSEQDLGSHIMFIGEIVDIGLQEHLWEDGGKIDLKKADLVAYCHGEYVPLEEPMGFFGYSVAKPDVLERRMREMRG